MTRSRWPSASVCLAALAVAALPGPGAASTSPGTAESSVIASTDDVVVEQLRIHDPLPGSAPRPEACDFIDYVRYRLADGPDEPSRADAVLVGAPGAWLGAYSLDRVARNTLDALARRGVQAEWWSIPRRSVCAFDLTGLRAANRAGDGRLAFDYYYGGRAIGGETFAGFGSGRKLRYLAEIGLAHNVHDIHEVLARALPDPEFRRTKVFCGGHSDGGLIMGAFGAWDFGGGPETAGFQQCAGFFAIDSLIVTDPGHLQAQPRFAEAARLLGGLPYPLLVTAMKAGLIPSTYDGVPIVAPETMALLPVLGSATHFDPDAETDAHRRLPRSLLWETTTRLDFARTHDDFLTGRNALRDFRFTNEALLGMFLDDNSLNLAPMQMSIGAISGGPLAAKTFPVPSDTTEIPGLGYTIGALVGPSPRVGPTDTGALYGWRSRDEVEGIPFTSPADEVVDIGDLARQLAATPGGSVGWLDPYYTQRYSLDILAAYSGMRVGDLAPMRYDAQVAQEPILTVFGTKSWTARTDAQIGGIPEDTVWVEGYTHIDPVTGAAARPDGGEEPVAAAVAAFVTEQLTSP